MLLLPPDQRGAHCVFLWAPLRTLNRLLFIQNINIKAANCRSVSVLSRNVAGSQRTVARANNQPRLLLYFKFLKLQGRVIEPLLPNFSMCGADNYGGGMGILDCFGKEGAECDPLSAKFPVWVPVDYVRRMPLCSHLSASVDQIRLVFEVTRVPGTATGIRTGLLQPFYDNYKELWGDDNDWVYKCGYGLCYQAMEIRVAIELDLSGGQFAGDVGSVQNRAQIASSVIYLAWCFVLMLLMWSVDMGSCDCYYNIRKG